MAQPRVGFESLPRLGSETSAGRRRALGRVDSGPMHSDRSWFGEGVDRIRQKWRDRFGRRVLNRDELENIEVRIRGSETLPPEEVKSLETNSVSTSKYHWWSFVFVATLLQMRRGGTAFYVLICIVNSIGYFYPDLYTVTYVPWGTILILLFVIAVALIFEAKDDIERHRADLRTNNKRILKLHADGTHEEVSWGSLLPGDVVRIEKGDMFPADVLLVQTSVPTGVCYIETSGIDGETNLKIRTIPKHFKEVNMTAQEIAGEVICEEPNSFLQFSGRLASSDFEIGLGFNSMVLRGSQLRNTQWADGVVIYAGQQTKLIQSSGETPSKFSKIDTVVNRMMGYILAVYLIVVLLSTLLLIFWIPNTDTLWYFFNVDTVNGFTLPSWLAFFLTFSGTYASVVPINMYVCLEIVNFVQGRFINWDLDMYDQKRDTFANCRTGSLVAEVGQISDIFTDKTGTLTNNVMRLVGTSIDGEMYGFKPEMADPDVLAQGVELNISPPPIPVEQIFEDLISNLPVEGGKLERFLAALALCHTVVIDYDANGEIEYNAEGPDEEALVSAAAKIGVKLVNTEDQVYKVTVGGEERVFKILGVNSFSSARKRMSVVVTEEGSSEHWMYIKGADNVMLEICNSLDDRLKSATDEHLQRYSLAGLRTLVIGGRKVSTQECDEWLQKHEAAGKLLGAERKKGLADAAALIEKDFDLFGVTAIEDALQEEVAETIQMIRDGGINLWVLTGDKIQTAINIALSAKILDGSMTRVLVDGKTQDDVVKIIESVLAEVAQVTHSVAGSEGDGGSRNSDDSDLEANVDDERRTLLAGLHHSMESLEHAGHSVAKHLSLVISGKALNLLLQEEAGTEETQKLLLSITTICSVVLACRVSPKQKALVVRMVEKAANVKKYKEPVTLSIGDGANDVPMIQEARVGVGIAGQEGLQAANSSDFSIARFKHLRQLLFVHGRWNYIRNSLLVRYICYSWLVLVILIFMYVFYSMISGQSIYPNDYYTTLYAWVTNSVITAIAWFQKDLTRKTVFQHPWVYFVGIKNRYMSGWAIIKTCARSIIDSAVIIGVVFYTLPNSTSLDTLGCVVYTAIFLVMFSRQALIAMTIPLFVILCFVVCAIFFLVGVVICDVWFGPGFPLLFDRWSAPIVWTRAFLACICTVALQYTFLGIPRLTFPDDLQVMRESDRYPNLFKFEGTPPIGDSISGERRLTSRRTSQLVRAASQRIQHLESLHEHRSFVD